MKRLRLAWAGVAAAVLIGVAVLIAVALNVGRTSPERDAAGPAVSGNATSPQTEASSEAARGETQEPSTAATDTESADASGTVSPGDEEEVVLTDPLGGVGMDPSVAEAFPDFARVLGEDDIRPIYAPVLVSAEESGLQDGDHVMGLAIDGEARAYPVRELFSREMVNDEVAGVPVLVTW